MAPPAARRGEASEAGLTNETTYETRPHLFRQMEEMLVFTPQLGTEAADHVRLIAESEELRPILGQLRRAAKAVQRRAPIPNTTHPPPHIGEDWDVFSPATAIEADSADKRALGKARGEAATTVSVA